jgi:hypothetical protein
MVPSTYDTAHPARGAVVVRPYTRYIRCAYGSLTRRERVAARAPRATYATWSSRLHFGHL